LFIVLKGTVGVNSSESPCKDGNDCFTIVLSDQLNFEILLFSIVISLLENALELSENKNF